MTARYVQTGDAVDYINKTGETIHYGDVVALPACIGIALADIPAGSIGALGLTGAYEMPAAAESIGYGAAVYWHTEDRHVSATAAGGAPAGISLTDKTSAAAGPILVRLTPGIGAPEETAPQA